MDTGIWGTNIYVEGHIHSLVPQGLKSTYYVAGIVIAQRKAQSPRTGVFRKLCWRRKCGARKRGAQEGRDEGEDSSALSRPTKRTAFMSWGFPDKYDFSSSCLQKDDFILKVPAGQ